MTWWQANSIILLQIGACIVYGMFWWRMGWFYAKMSEMQGEQLELLADTRDIHSSIRGLCKRLGRLFEHSRHAPELLDDPIFREMGFGESQGSEALEPGRDAHAELPLQPMKHAERSPAVSTTTALDALHVLASTANDKPAGSPFGLLQ